MSPERLTLEEAKALVAGILLPRGCGLDPERIDWTCPAAEAGRIFEGLHGIIPHQRHRCREVAKALLAYRAHLDFEAGRAFERHAVERSERRLSEHG